MISLNYFQNFHESDRHADLKAGGSEECCEKWWVGGDDIDKFLHRFSEAINNGEGCNWKLRHMFFGSFEKTLFFFKKKFRKKWCNAEEKTKLFLLKNKSKNQKIQKIVNNFGTIKTLPQKYLKASDIQKA